MMSLANHQRELILVYDYLMRCLKAPQEARILNIAPSKRAKVQS
jgi:hypothetical protein